MPTDEQNIIPEACVTKGPRIAICEALSEALDGKVVKQVQLTNVRTGEPTRQLIVLHTGEHRKKGIVMNHCPFCGGDLVEFDE